MNLEESKASTLITQFLVHISDSGVGMHNKSDLHPLSHDEVMSLRDEFIAQLKKPEPVLIGTYDSMEWKGCEVQAMHPNAKVDHGNGCFSSMSANKGGDMMKCTHRWSELVNTYSGTRQFRACTKCNMVRFRTVACSNDSNLQAWNTTNQIEDKEGI